MCVRSFVVFSPRFRSLIRAVAFALPHRSGRSVYRARAGMYGAAECSLQHNTPQTGVRQRKTQHLGRRTLRSRRWCTIRRNRWCRCVGPFSHSAIHAAESAVKHTLSLKVLFPKKQGSPTFRNGYHFSESVLHALGIMRTRGTPGVSRGKWAVPVASSTLPE